MPTTRYDLSRDTLAELLPGEPRYRVDQVWHGLYRQLVEPGELTTLGKSLRERLSVLPELGAALTPVLKSVTDNGDTIKWLHGLHDSRQIETVLMHYPDRSTVCVSSQAGCAMACGFCATGQAGFDRHLSTGEIVEQVVRARQHATAHNRRVTNVVFMGMGEPLANFDRVWAAVERLHHDMGIGARHLTISTVGIVPGIARLTQAGLPVGLAVSLHAANDQLRNELVPINRRYRLDALMQACRQYIAVTNRRLSFEWALIDGVNDRSTDAAELAALARPLGAHVNVIPLNPTPGYAVQGSSPNAVRRFVTNLNDLGVNATVRQTRGTEIDAACGQLRASASASAPGAVQPGAVPPGAVRVNIAQHGS